MDEQRKQEYTITQIPIPEIKPGQTTYIINRFGKRADGTTYQDIITLTPDQTELLLRYVRNEIDRLEHRAGGKRTYLYEKLTELMARIDI